MQLHGGRSDRKQYRIITLENGLEALLIHEDVDESAEPEDDDGSGFETEEEGDDDDASDDGDDESDGDDGPGPQRAAAAMVVGVGSWADPPETQGCAHFLEHLLFLGSEKYPDENAYDAFLSKHGGSSNAATDVEWTEFHFDCLPAHFPHALDVFAQFFVAPSFNPEAVSREVQAIESEFRETIRDDFSRLDELLYRSAPAGHPFGTFTWGNAESLRQGDASAVAAVKALHDAHYHASNMKLAVVSTASLDETEAAVRASFAAVRASPAVAAETEEDALRWRRPSWDAPPAALPSPFPGGASALARVAPIRKDTHEVRLLWPLGYSLRPLWRSAPAEVATHFLGHEGPKSALAALRRAGLATELTAGVAGDGVSDSLSCGALFAVTIELTALGAARWACAAACVFEYARACVAALDAEPARVGAVGAELAAVAELGFDYAGEDEADELVEELAKLMLPMYGIPRASLLRARHECREEAVGPEALAVLKAVADPGACRVELLDSALAADDAAEPAAPCPGCPRCSGRAGFHAALDALAKKGRRSCAPVDAPPPPPPDAWTPYGALATARPAEPPATEPRFGTEYWASPVPAPLVDLWRTSRAWPGLGVPAANPFVGSAPALAGAGVAPRAAPDAAEAAAVAAAADACAAFAAGWKGARGAAAAPAKGKKKRKPPTGDAPARKLAGDAFPRPRDVDAAPARLESDGRVWVAPRAARFELPRLEICVRLAAPLPPAADGAAVATHLAMTALCAALLRDAVAEDLYAATVAHLFYSVSSSSGELVLRCGGVVSDAVPRLADALVDGLAGLAAAEPGAGPWAPGPRFDAAVSALRRDLGNSWHEDPAKHARKLRLCALVPGRNRPPGVRRAALDGAAPADARAHLRAFLAGAKWDALVHGNVADGGEAVRAALAPKLDALAGGGAGAAAAVSPPRVLRLRRGATAYVTEPSEDPGCATSAVEIYYQLGPDQRPAAATIFRER